MVDTAGLSRARPPRHIPARARGSALACTVLIAVAACAPGAADANALPAIVDGWATSEPVTCAAIYAEQAMPSGRCEALVRRAIGYATEQWGAPERQWMDRTLPVDAQGSPVLITSGAGVPDAIIVVEVGGAFHAAAMGCFQPHPPSFPVDGTCP